MEKLNIFIKCVFLTVIIFFSVNLNAQNGTTIETISDSLYQELLEVRKYLYNNPELAGTEKITSSFIEKYLVSLGLEVKTNIGGYGVVGILNECKKGKKIAWRADMDAISNHKHIENELHTENSNAAHYCGHDVHTTIALGIATILAKRKSYIQGTVYFIFQPSEENYKGARAMLADGLLDIIQPDEIYAAHISPMPVGLIASKKGYLFADYKQINITFKKTKFNDELITYTKNILSDLQNVAPNSDFWRMDNLMRPDIGIGSPKTIFKDFITVQENFEVIENNKTITISGYLSASNKKLMEGARHQLQQQIAFSRYAKKLKKVEFNSSKFVYSKERANITNNAFLVEKAIEILSKNKSSLITTIPLYGVIPDGRGDDFAYFQKEIPSVYFFIGGSNFKKGMIAMPHTPNFTVDTNVIKVGVTAFSSLLMKRVNEK